MTPLAELVGESPGIVAIRERVRRLLAHSPTGRRLPPVLIQGETGTGKGLLARALHRASSRAGGPFVDVNCAAIPETLLEVEMFGFERGAFTDARQPKRGLFQAAHKGLLFLDEVGLLPEGLQAKLLTAIEERAVRRLGSTQSETVDVWVVAATNADLEAATRARRFREDLYHRLAVLTLRLPPLRERGADIPLLAERFLGRACEEYELPAKTLAPDARAALARYSWPGNVRELSNLMERVTLLAEGSLVTAEMLGLPEATPRMPEAGPPRGVGLAEAVENVQRAHIAETLHASGGNISRAAARLGVTRNTLRYRMERLGLTREARQRVGPSRSDADAPPPTPAEHVSVPAVTRAVGAVRWERRRLTVLRAAVGSAPGEGASLETNRTIEICVEKIRSFGGRIEALSPQGVTAVYGLDPVEDAPRRAALAALAIRTATGRGQGTDPAGVPVRVGVHTGQILVGRVGDTALLDQGAQREAESVLEALLQRVAPGSVLVSGAAAAFLERRFELVPRPSGDPAARVYTLERLGPSPLGLPGRVARFVGREHELTLLRGRFESALRGQGQVVGITGEPGIGKSRLLAEFRQGLAGGPVAYLESHCLSHGTAIPYLPLLDLLRATCGITEGEGAESVRLKVRELLERAGVDPAGAEPLLLPLLGLPDGPAGLGSAGSEVIKMRTFETLREVYLRLSQRVPLVIVVEDLHWIDGTSEECLTALVQAIPMARILLVETHRPGHQSPWVGRSYVTQMALPPLGPAEALSIVRELTGPTALADPLVELILVKAEGNPFFLEELARAAREEKARPGGLGVPDTVEEVLLARIDRLPPSEKHAIQCAAVIGKSAPLALLRAVADLPEDVLRTGLLHLEAAELVYEVSSGPEVGYTFKHALTHEVAYQSLLPEQRRALHARIAETIERRGADRLAEQVEQVASHALRGELWGKALGYLRQAGAKAASRSAHREAVSWLELALEAHTHLPVSRETILEAIDLRFELRNSLHPLGELARILDHLREAERLAESVDEPRRLGWVSSYMTQYYRLTGTPDRAITSGERALAIAGALGESHLRIATNAHLGPAYRALGEYRRAVEILRANLESLPEELTRETLGLAGLPFVICTTNLAWCLAEVGDFEEAATHGAAGVRVAEAAAHPYSVIFAYLGLGSVFLTRGDLGEGTPLLERALRRSREWTVPVLLPVAASFLGSAYALLGRLPEALPLLEEAVAQADALALRASRSAFVGQLAEAHLRADRPAEAEPLAHRALELARAQRERGYEAHARHVLGEVAAHPGRLDADRAESHYLEGRELAGHLGMRPLVARCHLDLGRLYRRIGRRLQAVEQLRTAARLLGPLGMRRWQEQAESELRELG
jgi:transcriptional regulator with AAA-type ATPase domain/tetratricopeptide (TPR) repeat protein